MFVEDYQKSDVYSLAMNAGIQKLSNLLVCIQLSAPPSLCGRHSFRGALNGMDTLVFSFLVMDGADKDLLTERATSHGQPSHQLLSLFYQLVEFICSISFISTKDA